MPRPVNPNLAAWIAEYEAGATLTEIGERYGVDRLVIWRALRKAGTAMRPKGAVDKLKHGRGVRGGAAHWHGLAIAERQRGAGLATIANRCGVSVSAVSMMLKRKAHA